MKTKFLLMLTIVAMLFTASCTKYPPTSDRLLEDLAIITQYDTKVDFNNYKTFAIANSITKITDKDTTQLTGQLVTDILNKISVNMKSRGFEEIVATPQNRPDFGIQVVYFQNTYIYAYYYDWWGYYPYWYYYYPYYPVYYSSYTTGLADIQLIDLKYPNNNNTLALRWDGYIRGLLTGSHSDAEILNAVDQAFEQTPQLVTTAK